MKYFVVFQNQTFKEEREAGILWAPTADKNGKNPKFYWESMTECKIGDVVFSVVNNIVISRGIVVEKAVISDNPFYNDRWEREGWLVKLDYFFSINQIKVTDYIEQIAPMLPDKYSPFVKTSGRGNQGYLYAISNEFGAYLDNLVGEVFVDYEVKDLYELNDTETILLAEVLNESKQKDAQLFLIEEAPPTGSNIPKKIVNKVYGNKINFIKKAERDIEVGVRAEMLVVLHEKSYLSNNGRADLVDLVKWVSKEADGYGYDVLSFDLRGEEKYIEVKSTSLGSNNPFDISENEVETSKRLGDKYWIYRVYHIEDNIPRFCKYQGSVDNNFILRPTSYKAFF
ncbi:MAG: DUF3883 domain-containing protein [Candidatus Izemoplasmatales bacterium]|jgi:hypothetical protein